MKNQKENNLKYQSLNHHDYALLKETEKFLLQHYVPKQHVVACIMKASNGKKFYGLHLDVHGIDGCAEPVAIVNASIAGIFDKGSSIDIVKVVSVISKNGKLGESKVANPCGNCRQALLQYTPKAWVIVQNENELIKMKPKDLLPVPYIN